MAPSVRARLTQEEFDSLVKENMEEFGMEREEAVEDAIKTFTMQGVSLTGIVTTIGDDGQLQEHAAKVAVQRLRDAVADLRNENITGQVSSKESLMESLSGLKRVLSVSDESSRAAGNKETNEAESAVVAAQNGGMAAVMDVLAVAVPVTTKSGEEREGGEERSPEATTDIDVMKGRKTETVVPIDAVAACSALSALLPLLQLGQSEGTREEFFRSNGPAIATAVLKLCHERLTHPSDAEPIHPSSSSSPTHSSLPVGLLSVTASCASVACMACEANKEALMNHRVHDTLLACIAALSSPSPELPAQAQTKAAAATVDGQCVEVPVDEDDASASLAVAACCDALRSFATNDDPRLLASHAFANARKIADAGAVSVLLSALSACAPSPPLPADTLSSSIAATQPPRVPPSSSHSHGRSAAALAILAAMRSVAANDDICRRVQSSHGVPLVLSLLSAAVDANDPSLAAAAAALLSQLAGSDSLKAAIVEAGGVPLLVACMRSFVNQPAVVVEAMSALTALSLRNPSHCSLVVSAGALEYVLEAMQSPAASPASLQQACHLLRNLAVRNPEHRSPMLDIGFGDVIRHLRSTHKSCRDAGTAALRDMGVDDYKW